MKKIILVFGLCLVAMSVYAKDVNGAWVTDKKTGCQVWISSELLPNLSIIWNGECKNGKVAGKRKAF